MLRDQDVQVVLALDARGVVGRLLQPDLYAARVRPVLGVRLLRLEKRGETQAGAGVCDLARERVAHGEGGRHAPALGEGAARVKVDGVEALEGGVGGAVGVVGERLVGEAGGGIEDVG